MNVAKEKTVRHPFDVEANYNMIFLPTHAGCRILNLRTERPIHDGGHMQYNIFVDQNLNECHTFTQFLIFITLLFKGLRGFKSIPWR